MTGHHDGVEREHLVDAVRRALAAHDDPGRLEAIRAQMRAAPVRGGTTLRAGDFRRRWWVGGGMVAAAAAVVLAIFLPAVDRRTTVSAAEILGRSRAALGAVSSGVEVLTYDLAVDGVLRDLLPFEQTGRLSVQELIDHDHPGRYRLLKLAPDGEVVGAIADDPPSARRVRYLRADGRGYLLRFSDTNAGAFSFLTLKRLALQGVIAVMQAQAGDTVREVMRDDELCYEVSVVEGPPAAGSFVSLVTARALITSADYRVVEFAASGLVADRPFGIDFALKTREVRPSSSTSDADFDITARPGDIVLHGDASSNPVWDIVQRVLATIPQQPER